MGKGLRKQAVPVFVSGGVDTTTDPKLVPAGAVVQANECQYSTTGALSKRNAVTSLSQNWVGRLDSGSLTSINAAFPDLDGKPLLIGGGTGATLAPYKSLFKYSDSESKWVLNERTPVPMPTVVTAIDNVDASRSDQQDPDCCVAANAGVSMVLTVWSTVSTTNGPWFTVGPRGGPTTNKVDIRTGTALTPDDNQCRAIASTKYACVIWAGNDGSLRAMIQDTSNLNKAMASCQFVLAAPGSVFVGGGPRNSLDVIKRPGSNNCIVAYPDNGTGISLVEFNPATGAVIAGPVNVAAADCNQAACLLDDQLSTGFYWLATAGTTAGVVVRKLTTAFAVSATTVVDATATASVQRITGYTTSSGGAFNVLWDLTAAALQDSSIRMGTSTPSVSTWQRAAALISKAWKHDGIYYTIVGYRSSQQTTNVVLAHYNGSKPQPAGVILPNVSGGENSGGQKSRLTSVVTYNDGVTWVAGVVRKVSNVSSGGSLSAVRGVASAYMNMAPSLRRPRQLNGQIYIPGGILTVYDGVSVNYAQSVIFPEAPTLASSATGGMTPSGQYQYLIVYRTQDSLGRITRSAASIPTAITLGAGDGNVQVTLPTARLATSLWDPAATPLGLQVYGEIYRAGPAAAGGTQYNKIAEVAAGSTTADSVTFTSDTKTDAQAAAGELLYDSGGVLDNFCPPSCSLLETWNQRLFLVDAEYPTRIWFSKQIKAGTGIGFNPLLTILCDGDAGGPITALCAMDQYLVVFKRSSILVFTGDGPNDANQGSFSQPQLVTTAAGTLDPGSVILTPDGVMFNDYRQGFMLLTRGLSLNPIGFPVGGPSASTALGCSDSAIVPALSQVRFWVNFVVYVWHYVLKKWTTMSCPSTGTISLAIPGQEFSGIGGAVYEATPGNGAVRYEALGSSLGIDTSLTPDITLPPLLTDGIGGYQKVYGAHISGTTRAAAGTLFVEVDYDEEGSFTETHSLNFVGLADPKFAIEVAFNRRKCRSVQLHIFSDPTCIWTLMGVKVLVGTKERGIFPVSVAKRMLG